MRNKIIIVDKNDLVRAALVHILCDEYMILEATGSSLALDLLSQSENEIAAILIDIVTLPG